MRPCRAGMRLERRFAPAPTTLAKRAMVVASRVGFVLGASAELEVTHHHVAAAIGRVSFLTPWS
jgi:hypothetical protein